MVAREWLTAVNPIVSPAVSTPHLLMVTDAAEAAALTDPKSEHVIAYSDVIRKAQELCSSARAWSRPLAYHARGDPSS